MGESIKYSIKINLDLGDAWEPSLKISELGKKVTVPKCSVQKATGHEVELGAVDEKWLMTDSPP